MTGILSFIIVFGVLVTVHELGHLIFAKRAGILCPEFAVGMGPKIFSYKHNDTLYTIRLIPVGGYVRMASSDMEINPLNEGMRVNIKTNDNNEVTHILLDDKHNFTQIEAIEVIESDIQKDMYIRAVTLHNNEEVIYPLSEETYVVENSNLERVAPLNARFENQSVPERFMALFAGPLFNFLLAFVLFTLVFYLNGKPTDEAVVGMVQENSPAEEAGITEGDKITSINDESINSWSEMTDVIQQEGATNLSVNVENDGQFRTLEMTPELITEELIGDETRERLIIGITPERLNGIVAPVWWGIEETIQTGTLIFTLVVELFRSIFVGEFSFDMLNGPVGIYKVTDEVSTLGIIPLIIFTATLSVNLGIMNLLPIPALDGGRILFVLYEGLFRKPLNKRVALNIQLFGVLFVLIIMILVTWNDIKTFFL